MLEGAERRLEILIDSEDERVGADVSKFIAKTLGKNEGYSERTELTGKDGEKLIDNEMSYERAKAIIAGKGSDTGDSKE